MFEDIPTIDKKAAFVVNNSRALRRKLDLTKLEDKQALAHNISCLGSAWRVHSSTDSSVWYFHSLAKINSGIGQMFRLHPPR
jgi:ribonucleoside-diphosphate reductase beta chain